MSPVLSVCIPVYNESPTLGRTLDSLLLQESISPGEMQITICANGCTDDTAEVVRAFSRNYPTIELQETPIKGKARAWNLLRRNAKANEILFMDGDVVLERSTVRKIYGSLQNSDNAIVGARGVPYFEDFGWRHKCYLPFLFSRPNIQTYIMGGCYGINNVRLQRILQGQGLKEMPENITGEDFFLNILTGESRDTQNDALFYYRPYGLFDALRVAQRHERGNLETEEALPELFRQWKTQRSVELSKRLSSMEGIMPKILYLSGVLLRRAVYTSARFTHKRHKEVEWFRSELSKTPLPLELAYAGHNDSH